MKFCAGITFFLSLSLLVVASNDLLLKTYDGLNKVLNFMFKNSEDIILDGLLGIVFTRSNLNLVLTFKNLQESDKAQVTALINKATDVINLTKHTLPQLGEVYDLFYYIFLNDTIMKAENFGSSSLDILYSPNINQKLGTFVDYLNFISSSDFSHHDSDYCLSSLIRERLQSGGSLNNHSCPIPKICNSLMLIDEKIRPGYGVTHQLLFLMTGKRIGCFKTDDWYKSLSRSRCSYIFWEAKQNYKFNFIRALDDLLLEQISLCGMEGFEEFLNLPFMKYVLSLQTEEGCFGIHPLKTIIGQNINNVRKKRSVSSMRFGCNDHTTGLGSSVLSLILRKLLDDVLK